MGSRPAWVSEGDPASKQTISILGDKGVLSLARTRVEETGVFEDLTQTLERPRTCCEGFHPPVQLPAVG